jgi:hypothetical protein
MQSTGHSEGSVGNVAIATVTNPVSSTISAAVSSPFSCTGSLHVYSMEGRLVISTPMELDAGSNSISIPARRLPPGVYVLRIVTDSSADSALFTLSR